MGAINRNDAVTLAGLHVWYSQGPAIVPVKSAGSGVWESLESACQKENTNTHIHAHSPRTHNTQTSDKAAYQLQPYRVTNNGHAILCTAGGRFPPAEGQHGGGRTRLSQRSGQTRGDYRSMLREPLLPKSTRYKKQPRVWGTACLKPLIYPRSRRIAFLQWNSILAHHVSLVVCIRLVPVTYAFVRNGCRGSFVCRQ